MRYPSRLLSRLASAALLLLVPQAALAADTEAPEIQHQHIEKAPMGQPLRVRATITDESGIFAPTLYVRAVGQEDFVTLEMTKKGKQYEAQVPGEQMGGDIEYFIEAFDEHGNGPARKGAPEAPLLVPVFDPSLLPPTLGDPLTAQVSDDDDRPLTEKWWFWTLVGVAVAGGVTTAIILASSGGVDEVSVLVRAPDPSGVLK